MQGDFCGPFLTNKLTKGKFECIIINGKNKRQTGRISRIPPEYTYSREIRRKTLPQKNIRKEGERA